MLEINMIMSLLGHPVTDHELAVWLNSIGVDSGGVVLESGKFTLHIEMMKEGFSLTFTDEAMYFGKQDQPVGDGPLYFTGVFFYSDGKDGYREYKGVLPMGLDFSNTHQEVLDCLGVPSYQRTRSDGSVISERWDHPDYSLSVTYAKGSDDVTLISLFRPCS